ncbi:hypothetical protein H4I96_11489 [Botrytis cinerea]
MSEAKGLQPGTLPIRHMVQLAHDLLPFDSADCKDKIILDRPDDRAIDESEREGDCKGEWDLGMCGCESMRCAGFGDDGAGSGGQSCVCELGAVHASGAETGAERDEEGVGEGGRGSVYFVEGEVGAASASASAEGKQEEEEEIGAGDEEKVKGKGKGKMEIPKEWSSAEGVRREMEDVGFVDVQVVESEARWDFESHEGIVDLILGFPGMEIMINDFPYWSSFGFLESAILSPDYEDPIFPAASINSKNTQLQLQRPQQIYCRFGHDLQNSGKLKQV